MIEEIVLNHLKAELTGVSVVMERVSSNPPFVLIEKTGSSRENHITTSTFAIQSYEKSLYKAASLNERVKTAMDGLVSKKEVSASDLNSDYNHTDTAKKMYRYQCVYDVVHL